MEKVNFQSPQDGEALEFYVIEQTRINGVEYISRIFSEILEDVDFTM